MVLVWFGCIGRWFFVSGYPDAFGVFARFATFLFVHVATVIHAAAWIAFATGVCDNAVLIQSLSGLLLCL